MTNNRSKSELDQNRCCHTSGERCICLPYDDAYAIAAQVLSIVAVLISWIWWVSFIVSVAALVLHQVIWCCRQSRAGIVAMNVVSIVAGLLCIFAGVFLLVYRTEAKWCYAFTLYQDDDDYWWNNDDFSDYCPEKAYASVAFVDAVLWFATAGCMMAFLMTGRYAKWEEQHGGSSSANETSAAVEMGNVEATSEPVAAAVVAEPAEYVPPEVAAKVDDAE